MKAGNKIFSGIVLFLINIAGVLTRAGEMPDFETTLQIAPTGGAVVVAIQKVPEFRDALDVFVCSNLTSGTWSVMATTNSESDSVTIPDTNSTRHVSCFYAVASAVADQDGDALSDVREKLLHKTDPSKPDTDYDGMPDGWEIQNNLAPRDTGDAVTDVDGDGWNNVEEYLRGGAAGIPTAVDTQNLARLRVETPMR